MIHDPARLRLGRKAARHDPRTLKLARYLPSKSLPTVPAAVNWGAGASPDWGMMLNDQYGCCTASGAGHLFKLWNDKVGRHAIITDPDVLALYEIVTRDEGAQFDPKTMANDNGCAELDVLKVLRNWGIAGRKIEAFAAVDPRRHDLIKATIWMFGGAYVGVELPLSAQDQDVWRVTNPRLTGSAEPGSWGGHCIVLTGYDAAGLLSVTWGQEKRLTWDWWDAYGDEAYALLAKDWIGANDIAPSDFHFAQLTADLHAVTTS